jgi:hypothetical protein
VGPVHDVAQQHDQTVRLGRIGVRQARLAGITPLGDQPHGTGRVVFRLGVPAVLRQRALRLGQRLGVGVDPADRVQGGARLGEQRVLDLLEVLGRDVHLVGEQPVEHREDRSGRGVLDGHDQPVDLAELQRIERGLEAGEAHAVLVGEQRARDAMAVGERLALVPDGHESDTLPAS